MRLSQIANRAGLVLGGATATLGTLGAVISMGPTGQLPAQTVVPKTQALKPPSVLKEKGKIFYVPGRGANVPDKDGKVEGDNAVEQAQSIADKLQNPVTLVPRRNYADVFKPLEVVSSIYNRLANTSKISTAKQLEELVKQSVKEEDTVTVIAHSAGGFETMDAAKALIPELSANKTGLVNIIFVGSPVASQDIENLKEFNFNSVNSLSNSADEIPNCVGIGGTGIQAWLYALGIGDNRGLTLGQCTSLFRQEHSSEEIKNAHRLENYLPAIKQTVENRK